MRKLLLLLFCAMVALPSHAARRVTVQQFEKVLASVQGKPDAAAADKISQFELTERISPIRAAKFNASLPGPLAKGELLVLADASAFFPLPSDEVLSDPAPDAEAQHSLLNAATQYATQTLSKLPNFFATRETILFMDAPQAPGSGVVPADQSMLFAARTNATVLYREGKEVVDAQGEKGKKTDASPAGLVTSGVFGPILATVLADAHNGELSWSHWEQIENTKAAVFRYVVTKPKSHYEAVFCCVAMSSSRSVFRQLTGYHGEIAVDPETGTILRITMQADLKPAYPMSRADLWVEYGPVEIGGRTYFCPLKSIALSRGFEPSWRHRNGEPLKFAGSLASMDNADAVSDGPEVLQTMMNHVVFSDYHVFRSETRILTEADQGKETTPSDSTPTQPAPSAPPQPN